LALNAGLEGKVYPWIAYGVTADAVRTYAAATNEVNPLFTGYAPLAPPAFPIVPAGQSIRAVLTDPELGVNMARLVQGEEEHIFHVPVKAGDELTVESTLQEVNSGEEGENFKILTTLTNKAGELAVTLSSLMVIRGGARRPATPGEAEPAESAPPEFAFETAEDVDEDQTYRYAEASGDRNLIHIDPEYAKNSAGMPGIICHGMCTMAFASRAVLDGIAGSDPARLRSIKVQFSRPVFPGQRLTTRGWNHGNPGVYSFETVNPRGQAVIKDGVAEIAT